MAGRIVCVDAGNPSENILAEVSSHLAEGRVVVYPSDTVYGILADASVKGVVEKVALLKGYKTVRPFIVLVGSITEALKLTTKKDLRNTMERHWPGPVTLVLPASDSVQRWLLSDSDTVAVRVPSDQLSRMLLSRSGLLLLTTSANRAGEPWPLSVQAVPPEIRESAPVVLDGGELKGRRPSRILDCTGETPVEVRR